MVTLYSSGCGFGCQLHHIVYCLIFAYATERTLILNSKGWRYNNKGWDYVFYPISDSCTSAYDDKVIQWPDARRKYPEYEFLGDPSIAKTAATHRRYTPLSLTGLLVDLHMLAMCDYIVCTFSSQVGRVAYEMMQTNRVDASDSFFSLDDIYYFGGQNAHDRVVVLPHTPLDNQDIALQVTNYTHSPLTTHNSPLTTRISPQTLHNLPLTTHNLPLTTDNTQLIIYHSPLTTHNSPLTTDDSQLTTHY
ncbi:unnamed protein product [Diatraea saccharalis]|uniref:GT23 domain-containing protein n=1 Tax=Diatraea saccharalis TaxID=40085 RepID=A0A9N9R351_9NEOP|nr:unnamed protein product [Diatraea saccharalis]